MSKLSFRARALDASKPMPVYKTEEIPDLRDFAAINRAVPQMPTGMEKEEESEHHLQRALSAQQVYGTSEALVIPIPDIDGTEGRYEKLYKGPQDFKPPKQYVHVQAFGMDQEIPDYDMDSEDETWLNKQVKKMEVTPLQFENMMDRLEKGSGQMVVTLQEAKALLKEDDDLIIAVYDYWLNKRLRTQHALIPQVKTEKRDGSTTNNPYVAFRRRTEKMQTRKNRKNDESSYEKMLKLRRDLNKALTILELMKRREKSKKEILQLTIEVVDKRYTMQDYGGGALSEAMAKRHTMPSYVPLQTWTNRVREESNYVRKKREYKKRKHKSHDRGLSQAQQASAQLPQYAEVDVPHDGFSTDEEAMSPPMSPSDQEVEDDPDGIYAFRRKAGCHYHAPINEGLGNWPWCGQDEGGFGEKKYRYTLTSLTSPRQCIGYARRRTGRGGRMVLDRAFSEWDDYIGDLDLSGSTCGTSHLDNMFSHVKNNKYVHFRPCTPTEDQDPPFSYTLSPSGQEVTEFNVESFETHQEQLLQMQRQQQEQLLKQESDFNPENSFDLEHSFSSQPRSRFTLDSAKAQFAASAVCNSTQELIKNTSVASTPPSSTLSTTGATTTVTTSLSSNTSGASFVPTVSSNGSVEEKSSGFSTSPAATVLQLNYPIGASSTDSSAASNSLPITAKTLSSSKPDISQTSSGLQAVGTVSMTQGTTLQTVGITNTLSGSGAAQSLVSTGIITLGTNKLSTLAASSSSPVMISRAGTSSSQTVLKLASGPNNTRNETIARENHENVNSVVKDQIVAMEVT